MYLPDVNIWLAASWSAHQHHSQAADWINRQRSDLYFCRITQMAFLRLISHPSLLGEDALKRHEAWNTYHALLSDHRIHFKEEPEGLSAYFEAFSSQRDNANKLWTDDYLAAFAKAAQLKLATFDKAAVQRYAKTATLVR
ncbi:TA system VapC family ribonuclease toxin [Pelagicoccus sp. SDUM812002]|uniref:TA system VapC family ribonuclease toxin n=1 Tax=Pelagicoccus sp. SDUM812002 TaxID=3041266 RepID=UPI00280CFF9D|nr:TA system VapC family ribonuclease toxin [Pelagicoccus sp. SDUM812002]MDQ8188170.1 hypothetical protein [Pelagicoccus sp. SDUM812002]